MVPKVLLLLLCLPWMPVKAEPDVIHLDCSGWMTGSTKTKTGEKVKVSKPHSVEIALEEGNSQLRIGKPNVGYKPQPPWEKARFGWVMIYSQMNSIDLHVNRTTGSYKFMGNGKVDNKDMENVLIVGKCKRKYPILF